jgi:hypothetical protein
MTSFICDTSEHEEGQKLPLVHDQRQGSEVRLVQEELLTLVDDLLMLLTLHELLHEGLREGDLPGSVVSEVLPLSQPENSEKPTHSKGSFAPEDESIFLKEGAL